MNKTCKNSHLEKYFDKEKCIVVKVGSDLIVRAGRGYGSGLVRDKWMRSIAEDVIQLRSEGKKIILVSSGAIALGRHRVDQGFNKTKAELTLSEKQAAAAFGQMFLMKAWRKAFGVFAAQDDISQRLLVKRDFTDHSQRKNVKVTLQAVLAAGGIPIINENDTAGAKEICYGDNDRLAARIGLLLDADTVVLLSKKINGLYKNWGTDQAQLIENVPKVTKKVLAMAKDRTTTNGTGGMRTKLKSADMLIRHKKVMLIARGDVLNPLSTIRKSRVCTSFGLS